MSTEKPKDRNDQEKRDKLAEKLEEIKQDTDVEEDQLMDAFLLENVTNTLFESEKDINTLKRYLKEVTGEDVTLANFTPQQIQALTKVMGIDKMYLEPCDKIDKKQNNCKQIVKISVKLSKAKDGFGLENLRDMLHTKTRIESENQEPENLATQEKQEGGQNKNE